MTRRLGLLALAVLIGAGCVWLYDYKDYELEVTETRAWAADDITLLDAETENGAITVTAADADTITAGITRSVTGKDSSDAAAHLDDIVVTDEVDGGKVTLIADMPSSTARNYGAAFDVTAPATVFLQLVTSNGGVTAAGMAVGCYVRTSNGGITLTDTEGEADLQTSNGHVDITNHAGDVLATTSNGAVDCDLAELAAAGIATIETSNGGVTVTLPDTVAATFDASTSNGTVTVSGFPSVDYTTELPTHKAGTIGGGGGTVTITTSNGNVDILAR